MCLKFHIENLNSNPYPSSHKNFYTCEITILLLISLLKHGLFHYTWYSRSGLFGLRCKVNSRSYDPFGLRKNEGKIEGSKVELTKNMLILGISILLYSTLSSSLSIQTDH